MDSRIKNFSLATLVAIAFAGFYSAAQAAKEDFSPVYFQPIRSSVSYATVRQPSPPTFNSQAPLPVAPQEQRSIEFLSDPPVEIRRTSNSPADTNYNDNPLPPVWLVTVPIY